LSDKELSTVKILKKNGFVEIKSFEYV